jgi:hypothetical protein
MPTPTPADVAAWMASEFQREGELYQADAAGGIENRFGVEFLNEDGRTIRRDVLAEFRKLTPAAVWDRRSLYWRRREQNETGRLAE